MSPEFARHRQAGMCAAHAGPGKKVVNAMYVNVGHVHHSVEREKQNVNVFWNTVSASSIPPPIFDHGLDFLGCTTSNFVPKHEQL